MYLCYNVENILLDAVFPSDNAADTKQEECSQPIGQVLTPSLDWCHMK